jgi:hypothetical protein
MIEITMNILKRTASSLLKRATKKYQNAEKLVRLADARETRASIELQRARKLDRLISTIDD